MKLLLHLLVIVYVISSLKATSIPETRIVNGEEAVAASFPYQVALDIAYNETKNIKCGGSLLNSHNILTAAHCFFGIFPATASFGSNVYMGGKKVEFSRVTRHENYNNETIVNDIAIIHLDTPVYANGVDIDYITLDDRSFPDDQDFVISGFGKINDTQETEQLYYALEKSITGNKCNETFQGFIKPTMMCGQGYNNQATCSGDSGGPAVRYDESGKAIQVGIVSFGTESCVQGNPDVFTRVFDYLDWIEEHMD